MITAPIAAVLVRDHVRTSVAGGHADDPVASTTTVARSDSGGRGSSGTGRHRLAGLLHRLADAVAPAPAAGGHPAR